ncbi:type II toxin-antitoxin system RelE/ParE family toxin [Parabacteroides sp.]
MSYRKKVISIELAPDFKKAFKQLLKRYRSLGHDLENLIESIQEDPEQGADLGHGLRKLRMAIASKGKGKSGGARVITHTVIFAEAEGTVKLLTIYDKSECDSITDGELRDLMSRNGLL